jgi:hypothetical protein
MDKSPCQQTFNTHCQYIGKPFQPSQCIQLPENNLSLTEDLNKFKTWDNSGFSHRLVEAFTLQKCCMAQVGSWVTDVLGEPTSPILKGQSVLNLDKVQLSLIAYFTSIIAPDGQLLTHKCNIIKLTELQI